MTNSSSNNIMNPNAREAMDQFKMEAAADLGVQPPQKNDDMQWPGTLIYIAKRLCLQAFPPFLFRLKLSLAQPAKNDIIISET